MEITKKYPICEKHGKYAMSPESQAILTCSKCEEEHEQDMQEADEAHYQMEVERRIKAGKPIYEDEKVIIQ